MTKIYRISALRVRTLNNIEATTKVSYQGRLYEDHSANTKLQPPTIPVGGSFSITSATMKFYGPGKKVRIQVELEVLTRAPGSLEVTRLLLSTVIVQGDTLTVKGPELEKHGNQSYRVNVLSFTNGLPDSYANAGVLKVT